jgi:hypothetical protein
MGQPSDGSKGLLGTTGALVLGGGASGDGWMSWYLNGEPVMDTLTDGNGQHGPITRHLFLAKAQAGGLVDI